MRIFWIVAVCLSLLAITGCAHQKRTLKSTRGLCYAYSGGGDMDRGPGGCMYQMDICDEFMMNVDGYDGNLPEALQSIDETYQRLSRIHGNDGCLQYVRRARDLAQQYCRAHAKPTADMTE
ncbi:hypothetical protein [Desulfobaculum bizertense]|uniref:Lipoprotein n=1 Tax=Desulfobaculum bizertense DSM 18034 TaxID=1121442 RepID=A0A1T4VP62_9BACT|nr:hypothetical protein [Desulfobaculum bizertense]UIJ38173.1 hypothetical protein LWC08_01030 [Desulfobaculum bizertense]SKA66709.1 hypothetical protein SAMN02745702_00651 [Desulfobaculum bizertense DSM 18034]